MAGYPPNQPRDFTNINYLSNFSTCHVVPPPDLSIEDRKSILGLPQGLPFTLTTDAYGDPEFVSTISRCQPLKLEHVMNSWQYRHKLEAQDVLPFLYLGPRSVARSPEFIRSAGITMLIAVRDSKAVAINPRIMDPSRFASADGIEVTTLDVANESDLLSSFRPTVKLLNSHLQKQTRGRKIETLDDVGGKVLVFCEAGDTRSPTFVALYLMATFGLTMTCAVQAVQARRFSIVIGKEFGRMLQNYECVLQAEREVAALSNNLIGQHERATRLSRKRSLEQAYSEDAEMSDADNIGATNRSGMAPFQDTDV